MTSTSQSEISTPLSLMLTPMKSLLPAVSPLELAAARAGAAAVASVGAGAAAGGSSRVAAAACACWRSGAPADAARAGAIGGSYSAGLSPDLPASAGVSRRLKLSMNSPSESVFHFMTLSFFDDYSLLRARMQPGSGRIGCEWRIRPLAQPLGRAQ